LQSASSQIPRVGQTSSKLPATEESAESSAWDHLQAFAEIANETFTDVERKTDHRECLESSALNARTRRVDPPLKNSVIATR
jgi:hypothetical protein